MHACAPSESRRHRFRIFPLRAPLFLKRLVNFSNSGDGTAVIRMQIHRQTQIIITDVAAAAEKGPRLHTDPVYYTGMLARAFLRRHSLGSAAADEQTSDRIWARDLPADCA